MHNDLLFEVRTPTDIFYRISIEEGRILYITKRCGVHVEHFLEVPHGHAEKLTKSMKNEAAKALGETNREKFVESYLPKNKRRLATQLVCLKAHFKIREVKTQWVIFQHRHFLEMGMTSLLTTTKERWYVLVSIGRMVRMSGNINLEISSLIPNFGKPL